MNLVVVQGAMYLDAVAARAWAAMDAAARAEYGVDLVITAPAGAYRPEAMVVDMWRSTPARRRAVYGVPLGVSVAKPKSLGGIGSVHEDGRCVDISNWSRLGSKQMNALAYRFGFVNTIATEPWHFEYRGGAGGGGLPIPPVIPQQEEDEDMPQIRLSQGLTTSLKRDYCIVVANGRVGVIPRDSVNQYIDGSPAPTIPTLEDRYAGAFIEIASGGAVPASAFPTRLRVNGWVGAEDFTATTPSVPGGAGWKGDLDAAVERVIKEVPPLSGAAARAAIVKP